MFRYETHMHTMEGSACAVSTGAEMADKYKAEGYTGIFVTDHFFNGNCAVPRELPWKEKVELYCKGYENALERGREIGLDVFFGFEFTSVGSDFLIYGLGKDWLLENEMIMDMETTRFLEYARSCGGFAVHAHPFREAGYIRGNILCHDFVDGVEVINASHPEDSPFDERARIYAEWYGLPMTAGSDAHSTEGRWYGGGVESEFRFTSCDDYARAVREGSLALLPRRRDI